MKRLEEMTDQDFLDLFMDLCSMPKDDFINEYGEEMYKNLVERESSVKIRHEMYHDVYVHPDVTEEWVSIGD